MNIKAFLINYARHRRVGLTEIESFNAAMTAPVAKLLVSPVFLLSGELSQPAVVSHEKTPASPDVSIRRLSPCAKDRVDSGDRRGRFMLLMGGL